LNKKAEIEFPTLSEYLVNYLTAFRLLLSDKTQKARLEHLEAAGDSEDERTKNLRVAGSADNLSGFKLERR